MKKSYGYAMLNDMGVRLDDPVPMEMNTMFDMAILHEDYGHDPSPS